TSVKQRTRIFADDRKQRRFAYGATFARGDLVLVPGQGIVQGGTLRLAGVAPDAALYLVLRLACPCFRVRAEPEGLGTQVDAEPRQSDDRFPVPRVPPDDRSHHCTQSCTQWPHITLKTAPRLAFMEHNCAFVMRGPGVRFPLPAGQSLW